MNRRVTHIALCTVIVAATPIYLVGMVLLFCLASIFHATRGLFRKTIGIWHCTRLMKLNRHGK